MPRKKLTPVKPAPQPESMPALPAAAIFSFLKGTRGAVTWSVRDLEECLKINAKEAARILAILEMQGYVQRKAGSKEWLTTSAGESVSGSKPPRFDREQVKQELSTLRERIAAVNRDLRADYKISKAVAFGDFLTDRTKVQAADVGIQLMRRDSSSRDAEGEAKKRAYLKQLQGKSRYLQVQPYQPWMKGRSHRDLL